MNLDDFDDFAAGYEPGHSHARHTDPATSKFAGRSNFTTLKHRLCLLMAMFDREDGRTAWEIEQLCDQANVQAMFGEKPLGRSGWHRITDCEVPELGWVEVLRDEDGRTRHRPGPTGKPQQVHRITDRGRQMARAIRDGRNDAR